MTDEQINAAAAIQAIAESMVHGADERRQAKPGEERGNRRWNPAYIRRQGRKLLEHLEALTEEIAG